MVAVEMPGDTRAGGDQYQGLGTRARPRRSRLAGRAAGAAAAVAIAIAVIGGVLAARMVDAGRSATALVHDASLSPSGPAGVGQDVPTSFGVVAVESVTKNAGPTAKALAGVTHGIQSLVPPDRMQLTATVTVTNLQARPIAYTPSQFSLRTTRGAPPDGGDRPIRLSRASLGAGTLQPSASVDVTLGFVVPRNGSRLWMAFRDRTASKPVLIDLGRTGRTPPGALARFHAGH